MSASFEVLSSTGSYSVMIESGVFLRYLREMSNAVILSDSFFAPALAAAGVSATFIEATENIKSLEASPKIIENMRRLGANRRTELVALGGGIIQDVSAFIASIYMRGLKWTYVPTTLLAMVDSCIGGKSSINVGSYKNLVGTFHPPVRVLIDPELAQTLPIDQRVSGMIEAVKICFCRGAEAFDRHLSHLPELETNTVDLEEIILNSLLAKKWFIEIDEFDKNERLLLNFGHTFGHAIEGASHYAVSHGIAVGLGILCALAFEEGRSIRCQLAPRVQRLATHLDEMIRKVPEIAGVLADLDLDEVLVRFESDKKHGSERFTLILVNEHGEPVIRQIEKCAAIKSELKQAVHTTLVRYAR
jgi:3-dehydroquinate synthase